MMLSKNAKEIIWYLKWYPKAVVSGTVVEDGCVDGNDGDVVGRMWCIGLILKCDILM